MRQEPVIARSRLRHFVPLCSALLWALIVMGTPAYAQLTENCTVSILNRTARVRANGTWRIPNVPASFGRVRARATCTENGVTRSGQSSYVILTPNRTAAFDSEISLTAPEPIPASLTLTAPLAMLPTVGATTQLTVTARFPDGSTRDVTVGTSGTNYTISNRAVATVGADGLVTAVAGGTVIISALNEGALGLIRLQVASTGGDSDGDGIPDDVEIANGLNPNDPTDAMLDPDGDGLSNKQELVDYSTNPQVADTDGDGVRDGLEIQTGSDPLNSTSRNLAQALTAIAVTPSTSGLVLNTLIGEATRQLRVTGRLRDDTTLDLTASATGTNYTSSDLNICNFGTLDGQVFAGTEGSCTITATNNGFTASASITVQTFPPVALSSIAIPGYANNVDVSGGIAYVAAGAAGLQVVDTIDPGNPRLIGALDTPGNANDVRVVGALVYVADGAAGLQIIDVSVPATPVLVSAVDTPGEAQDVVVTGTYAYVADGETGLQIIDVSIPTAPHIVGAVDTPGIARGVSVAGGFAIVADDVPDGGVRIVEVTTPANPQIRGSVELSGAGAKDVFAEGTLAYVVAFTGGFHVVDFSIPTTPRVIGVIPSSSGFLARDVEVSGQFALTPDAFFEGAVAISDISITTNPVFRARLDLSSGGQFYGTGIATDSHFVYMTGEDGFFEDNGSVGNSGLLIGQYLAFPDDTAGVPPMVTIVAPAAGETVAEGAPLSIVVSATDDTAVVEVDLLVNGQIAVRRKGGGSQPFTLTIPLAVTSLTISARATDAGGNVGISQDVIVSVVPDTVAPTAEITAPSAGSTVRERSTLFINVAALDDVAVTAVDLLVNGQVVETAPIGFFTFVVPVGITSLTLGARVYDAPGNVGVAPEVVVDVIPDLPPLVQILTPTSGTSAIERTIVRVEIEASDDVQLARLDVLVNGQVVASKESGLFPPHRFKVPVPVGATTLTLTTQAWDNVAQVGTSAEVIVTVTPDPGTTATGRVVDQTGNPIVGALVVCLDRSGLSEADGVFTLTSLPTIAGAIECVASYTTGTAEVKGGSTGSSAPIPGGTIDFGEVALVGTTSAPLYATATQLNVGPVVTDVAVRDLNGDGKADLIVAGTGTRIQLGNGDGTFQAPLPVPAGTNPAALVFGDMNGDGNLDLVTANGSQRTTSVVLGNGDGTFQFPRSFATGDGVQSVTVADFTGDGHLDVVTAALVSNAFFGGGDVSLFVGNGDGTLQPRQRLSVGLAPAAVAAADLDHDGAMDLIVGNSEFFGATADDVQVLLGNGDGSFEPARGYSTGSGLRGLAVTDLNHDGVLERV